MTIDLMAAWLSQDKASTSPNADAKSESSAEAWGVTAPTEMSGDAHPGWR